MQDCFLREMKERKQNALTENFAKMLSVNLAG